MGAEREPEQDETLRAAPCAPAPAAACPGHIGPLAAAGNNALGRLFRATADTASQGAGPLDPTIEAAITAERGAGSPLPPELRAEMEHHLGVALDPVRLHTGVRADALSRSVQAEAFTTGTDVFFSAGRYDPASTAGRELLAHELTHIAQQSTGPDLAAAGEVSHPHDPAEREAQAAAARISRSPRPEFGSAVDTSSGAGTISQDAGARPAEPHPSAAKILPLQRGGGNRGTGGMSTRRGGVARTPLRVQRSPTPAPPTLLTPDPGPAAGVKPAHPLNRVDAGRAGYISTLLDVIQKLKAERIESWRLIADVEVKDLPEEVLRTAVASAALGIGGIVGELASHSLEQGLYKTFADLAVLEAGDIAAEQAFNAAVADTARAITVGTDQALKESAAQNVKTALTSANQPGSTGKFNVFAEAMRLETISEQLATAKAFHLGAESTYESVAMAGRIMSLEAVEKDLAARPDIFHRSLTEAYMRILHDSDATAGRGSSGPAEGKIFVLPDIGTRDWLGNWDAPGLDSFTHFHASTRGLNRNTLMSLDNVKISDLKVDLEFAIDVKNTYSGLFQSPSVRIWLERDPNGTVRLGPVDDDAREWLGSYYSRISRELTENERLNYSLLGAQKLYDAVKDKLVHRPKDADHLVPD